MSSDGIWVANLGPKTPKSLKWRATRHLGEVYRTWPWVRSLGPWVGGRVPCGPHSKGCGPAPPAEGATGVLCGRLASPQEHPSCHSWDRHAPRRRVSFCVSGLVQFSVFIKQLRRSTVRRQAQLRSHGRRWRAGPRARLGEGRIGRQKKRVCLWRRSARGTESSGGERPTGCHGSLVAGNSKEGKRRRSTLRAAVPEV